MGKYHDKIGFVIPKTVNGRTVFEPVEVSAYGEMTQYNFKWNSDQTQLNDQIRLNNVLSIVCKPFLIQNLTYLKYVWYQGTRWSISNVQISHPRLILNIGEAYNGPVVKNPSNA